MNRTFKPLIIYVAIISIINSTFLVLLPTIQNIESVAMLLTTFPLGLLVFTPLGLLPILLAALLFILNCFTVYLVSPQQKNSENIYKFCTIIAIGYAIIAASNLYYAATCSGMFCGIGILSYYLPFGAILNPQIKQIGMTTYIPIALGNSICVFGLCYVILKLSAFIRSTQNKKIS